MPITNINPDGTVNLYGQKSGKIINNVKPEELANYHPALVGEYQEKIQAQKEIESAAALLEKGSIKTSDIPAAQKLEVISRLEKAGKTVPESQSASDKKKAGELGAVNNLIKNLEKHYQEAGGGEVDVPILSRILGKKKEIEGKLGFNDSANTYSSEKEGFAATLKSLTGDTGVLTDQDFARLQKLLPELGAKPQEAKNLLNDLRSQVSAKYGGKAESTTINPKERNVAQALFPASSDFIENNVRDAQTMTPEERAGRATKLAQNVNPGTLIQNLLTGQKEAGMMVAPLEEIASTVSTVAGGKALLGGGKQVLKKIFTGSGPVSEARKEAAKGLVANTKPLIDAGDDYVNNINPMAKKAWEQLKPAIKDKTDLPKLLDITSDWGKKAYDKSGDVRSIAEGQLKNHLYKVARQVEETASPQVAQLTKQLAKINARDKFVNRGVSAIPGAVAGGVSTAAALAALSKFFGGGQK